MGSAPSIASACACDSASFTEIRFDAAVPPKTKIFPRTFTTSSPHGCSSTASGSARANVSTFSRAAATTPDDTHAVPIPCVLDCDPGHDDAIALLLALASPELELLGVTTTYGNQTLAKTTANALRVLELVGRTEVPVAAGADRPLERELVVAAHVHGESGLDGPVLPEASTTPASMRVA